MPALVVMVIFASIMVATATPVHHFAVDAIAALTYTYDVHIVGLHHISPVGHTWSLGVEEQFYLVWPPLLAAWLATGRKARPLAAAAFGISALACIGIDLADGTRLLAFTPLGHSFELLAGALAATLPRRRIPAGLVAGSLAAVGVMVLAASEAARWEYDGGLVLFTIPLALIVLDLSSETLSGIGRLFTWRPAVWIGKRSYGVYLYHYPMWWLVQAEVTHYAEKPVMLVATFAMAAASYRWIEQPFLRRKRYAPASAPVTERAATPAMVPAI
jgi:peptidoglycan/LPS O-acetylase OafA/YrhL